MKVDVLDMRFLEFESDSPAMHLALDEAVLEAVERDGGPATLRLWESPVRFVVLGTTQRVMEEVYVEHCQQDGVPIMRRCTAGGCVLQGPGCLNFSLVLPFTMDPELRALHSSYTYILGRIASALAQQGVATALRGVCDLAVGDGKVSGNAQRRKRGTLLHHGTLVYSADYVGMARYLREPAVRPTYRGARSHAAFVQEVELPVSVLRQQVKAAFGVSGNAQALSEQEERHMRRLVEEKYSQENWIFRR